MEWYKIMAIPILIMEFVMDKGSGAEVSLLLWMEERIMGKGNNGSIPIIPMWVVVFTVFPNVFSSDVFRWNKYVIYSNFFSFTFLNLGST